MAEHHVRKGSEMATLAAAVGVAKAGDTIVLHEGVYASGLVPPAGVTIKAADGEKAVIDGGWKGERMTEAEAKASGVIIRHPGVTLIGLEIRNIKGRGVSVDAGGDDFTMRQCVIHDCVDGGFGANGQDEMIRNLLIEDCEGYRLSMSASFPGQETPVNGCWLASSVDGLVIRRTTVRQGYSEGMAAGRRSKNILFEDNVVIDTAHGGFYINRAQNVVLRRCVYYHTNDPNFLQRDGDPGVAIVGPGDEESGKKSRNWHHSENVLIENCLFVGGAGMYQIRYNLKPAREPGYYDGYSTRIQNLEVRNCTFVSGPLTRSGINIASGPADMPVRGVFKNNLFVFNTMKAGGNPFRVASKGVRFEGNAWTVAVPAGLPGSNVRVPVDALLNAPAPASAFKLDNYRPVASGPLVGPDGKALYGALEPLSVEPPPPPPPPDPEPTPVDWPALRALAAEATAESAAAHVAADKAARLMQTLDARMREYELAAVGGEE